jgi:hypothetical protein
MFEGDDVIINFKQLSTWPTIAVKIAFSNIIDNDMMMSGLVCV